MELLYLPLLFKRQPHKMAKHTPTICRQKPTNCLILFDHFVESALKGVSNDVRQQFQISLLSWSFFSINFIVVCFKEVDTEAVAQRCSVKKVFLEISENSLENTCARVLRPATLFKKGLWHRCFPVNFPKF